MQNNITVDGLVEQLKVGLEELRDVLDFEVDDLSKKELKRSVSNLRSLLIATMEHPFEGQYAPIQELSDEMKKLLQNTLTLRNLQTAIVMHSVADKALDEVEQEIIKEAEAREKGDQ